MDSRVALEIAKLRMRVLVLQGLVLRNDVVLRFSLDRAQAPSEAIRDSLEALEGVASTVERILLSDVSFRDLDDSERALYADEFREMVESMKSFVTRLEKNPNG